MLAVDDTAILSLLYRVSNKTLEVHRKESSMHHVVIGGNAAGMSAAAKIRRTAPADTLTVLEKSSIVSFGGCGLPYYVGDFFSDKRYLLHRSPERFREDGVDLRLNHTVTPGGPGKTGSDRTRRTW